jgi:hypothetical protein
MPDMPYSPTSELDVTLSKLMSASEAVRTGIATHVQRHEAERNKQRSAGAAARKLQQAGSASK